MRLERLLHPTLTQPQADTPVLCFILGRFQSFRRSHTMDHTTPHSTLDGDTHGERLIGPEPSAPPDEGQATTASHAAATEAPAAATCAASSSSSCAASSDAVSPIPARPDADDDTPQCKVCLESEVTAESGRLYRPCRCRGSMAVHVHCLQQWRSQAPNPSRCESCHFVYRTERERLAVVIAHPATSVALTALAVAGGLFACAEAYRIAKRSPRAADTRTYARQTLARMWRAAEFLSATVSVAVRRRSFLRDSDLLAAMTSGQYTTNLQRNDAFVETVLTGGVVVVALYGALQRRVQQWLATKAEQVLPFEEGQDDNQQQPQPPQQHSDDSDDEFEEDWQ